jgi:hypothetical protein
VRPIGVYPDPLVYRCNGIAARPHTCRRGSGSGKDRDAESCVVTHDPRLRRTRPVCRRPLALRAYRTSVQLARLARVSPFRSAGLCWVSARNGLTLRGAVQRPSQGGLKSHLRWSTFRPTIRILFYAIEMPHLTCINIPGPARCSTNSLRQPSDHAMINSIRPLESDGPQGARRVKLTEPSVESRSVACQPRQPGRSDQYPLASASLDDLA